MIPVFIGFDPVEAATWYTLAHSIHTRSSQPVSLTPVSLENLRGILTRERHPIQTNEFSFSRFLVPWMCHYEGWAIFMDCDMVMRDDIAKLWAMRDDRYAVMCVHHDHIPPEDTKYLGKQQTRYQRKNWSSVMLFNNARCRALTPEYVNLASGLCLHQFQWLKDEDIGYLPRQWNHLVGYDRLDSRAALVHYTTGGPYFKEYANCDYHSDWWTEHSLMDHVAQREPIRQIKE